MIIAPTWEMFERFTVVDGIVIGAWLMWVAWMVRATANGLSLQGRRTEAQKGRWVALLLFALGGLVAWWGWSSHPKDGPTLWSGLGVLAWGIGWLNVMSWRRTGKPLL